MNFYISKILIFFVALLSIFTTPKTRKFVYLDGCINGSYGLINFSRSFLVHLWSTALTIMFIMKFITKTDEVTSTHNNMFLKLYYSVTSNRSESSIWWEISLSNLNKLEYFLVTNCIICCIINLIYTFFGVTLDKK